MARPRKSPAPEGVTNAPADPAKDPTLSGPATQNPPEAPASAAPEQPPEAPPVSQDSPEAPQDAPEAPRKLKDFVAHHEQAAQDLGVVVVSITHPDAETGIRQGAYSGIRTSEGEPSATYSDGSTH